MHNLAVFADGFAAAFRSLPWNELDTGVEVNGNFNDSYRWVRSSKGIPDGLALDMVTFVVYDLPGRTQSYLKALGHIEHLVETLQAHGVPAFTLPRITADNENALLGAYEAFREQGYEGAMGKDPFALYQRKRTRAWVKLKPEETYDGKVEDNIVAGTSIHGEPLDRVTSLPLLLEDGSRAQVHGIPHDLGRAILEAPGKYVGQWVEFNCMERDRQGGYRHPVFKRFREAK